MAIQPVGGEFLHRLHPAQQGLLEGRRIESGEHASEGSLAGDAVGQVKEAGQPTPTAGAEFVDGGEGSGPGEDGADGDEGDVDQGVSAGAFDAGGRRGPGSGGGTWRVRRWA